MLTPHDRKSCARCRCRLPAARRCGASAYKSFMNVSRFGACAAGIGVFATAATAADGSIHIHMPYLTAISRETSCLAQDHYAKRLKPPAWIAGKFRIYWFSLMTDLKVTDVVRHTSKHTLKDDAVYIKIIEWSPSKIYNGNIRWYNWRSESVEPFHQTLVVRIVLWLSSCAMPPGLTVKTVVDNNE